MYFGSVLENTKAFVPILCTIALCSVSESAHTSSPVYISSADRVSHKFT